MVITNDHKQSPKKVMRWPAARDWNRQELAAKFNYDLHAMFAYWRAREAEEGRKVVSFELPPKEVQVDEEDVQDLAA